MRYTYAPSALRHKRARLAGMIEGAEQEQAKRREQLTALDATMRLFHPDADPATSRPFARSGWASSSATARGRACVLRPCAMPVARNRRRRSRNTSCGRRAWTGRTRNRVKSPARSCPSRRRGGSWQGGEVGRVSCRRHIIFLPCASVGGNLAKGWQQASNSPCGIGLRYI